MNKRVLTAWVLWLMIALAGCRVQKYPPELTQALPNKAPIGQEITLTGFQFSDEPSVIFTNIDQGTTFQGKVNEANDQTIKVVVPRMPIDNAQVQVSNEEGISDPVAFTVLQPIPLVTNVTPGNALPGQLVVITGDYLDQLQWVRFGPGGVNSFVATSPQSITVAVPAVPRGPQTLEVETIGGKVNRPYLIAGTPQITGFSPKRPRLSEEVTVQGQNLQDGVVRLNGQVMPMTKNTDTELRFSLPPTATSGKIVVTLYDQLTATTADSVQIAFVPSFDPNGFSIAEGVKDDRLIINGRNLRDVTSALLGTQAVTFRAISDTQLEITLPERTQTGSFFITLASLGGTTTSTQPFLYYNAPSNLTFSPLRATRGREVVVNGQSIYRLTGVTVNGRPAPITSRIESSEVKFTVPFDATSGPITLTNRAGSATTSRALTVVLPPVITEFTRKAIVGNRVQLFGNYLLDAKVYFAGSAGQAPNDGRNTDTELWVKIPNDAQTGPIRVVNDAGETATTVPFTALRVPSGIAFGPDIAKVGTDITITGQNLTDVTEVRFNGGRSSLAKFQVSGPNLVVTVPSDAQDGTICLTNEAGTGCSSGTFKALAPAGNITFTPVSNTIGGTITISGTNLTTVRDVRFNNGRSTAATFRVSGQSLIVTVPKDAVDGPICLINEAGTTCSASNFNALLPPANLSVSASSAAVGAEITISGANLATTKDVRFGKSSAAKFRVTATTPAALVVTVPADASDGPICVTNDGGSACTVADFTLK